MFYERLSALCKQKGMTPTGLVLKLGLSNATAAKWKKGSIPNGVTLQKIAAFFEVPIGYLLGENAYQQPEQDNSIQQAYNKAPEDIKKAVRKLLDL